MDYNASPAFAANRKAVSKRETRRIGWQISPFLYMIHIEPTEHRCRSFTKNKDMVKPSQLKR